MVLSVAALEHTILVSGLTPSAIPESVSHLIFVSLNASTCSHGTGHNPGNAAYKQDFVTYTSPVVCLSAWCYGSLPELSAFTRKDEGDGDGPVQGELQV